MPPLLEDLGVLAISSDSRHFNGSLGFDRSLNVYSGVKGSPELQCLSLASTPPSNLESIVVSPEYFGYQASLPSFFPPSISFVMLGCQPCMVGCSRAASLNYRLCQHYLASYGTTLNAVSFCLQDCKCSSGFALRRLKASSKLQCIKLDAVNRTVRSFLL